MKLFIRFLLLCLYGSGHLFVQTYDIQGQIQAKDGPLPFTNLNYVYTGPMKLLHFAGAPEQDFDALVISEAFSELGFKASHVFGIKSKKPKLEIFGGVKNILDAYQEDFDSGKNRDSNYIYGPATPRTVFIGLKLGNF